MEHSDWTDGSSINKQPRLIHDLTNIVYLVSAVYTCENKHRLLAHDDSVLKTIPARSIIPFVLLCRTGLTLELVDMCTSLCTHGMNFHKIETFIIEKRWETYAKKQDMLRLHNTLTEQSVRLEDFLTSPLAKSPSNNIISKCFLATFLKNEQLYLNEILKIQAGNTISFDHTFKVAANIGFIREDGKWIHQYDSLFIVMNGAGHILAWQLTKGTTFSQIESLLKLLKERSPTIKSVYIDECCKLRGKIKSALGDDVSVKLDLFHAIQRVTRTLTKNHPLFHLCTQDLQLVFRSDGDSGKKRMCSTPSPEIIARKMQGFVYKWENIKTSEGVKVFTALTLPAIERLRKHIQKGCISNIPSGAGTNKNERFHHHINSLFCKSKLGILMAYALLTVIIHGYNSSQKVHFKVVTKPIKATTSATHEVNQPMGILPKVREQQNLENSDHWEMELSETTIDIPTIMPILKQAVQKHYIMKALQELGLSRLQKNAVNFRNLDVNTFEQNEVTQKIEEKVAEYGLKIQQVNPDGDCFFKSLAINIMSNLDAWKQSLTGVGLIVNHELNTESLSLMLRKVYVQELLGERLANYESFVSHTAIQYSTEASKFLQSGYYDSELGNTMPLALATALRATIIIFSASTPYPMYVTQEGTTSTLTAFVVYTPSGPGHYDAAIPYIKMTKPNFQPKRSSCNCGVNSKSNQNSCKPSPIYQTRCKCLKNAKSCTSLCRCNNCANPNGQRPPSRKIRNRRRHDLQVTLQSSKEFAQQRGELTSEKFWSTFETTVLQQIMSSHSDLNSIALAYNNTVTYSKATYCTVTLPPQVVLRPKSVQEIRCKIVHINTHSLP